MAASASTRLQLFFDWDETITAHDTLALIPPPNTDPSFDSLGNAYMQDLDAFAATRSHSSSQPSHDDIAHAYGLPSTPVGISDSLWTELAYLDALDEVELASVRRTEHSRIFLGWDPAHARARASSTELVRFRPGWQDVVAWLSRPGTAAQVELHIISVSWSSTFIRAGLASHPASLLSPSSSFPTSLNANDPTLGPDGLGTGTLSKSILSSQHRTDAPGHTLTGIRTGRHKLAVLRSLTHHASSHASSSITVYVGDSSTDLPCLLHAHLGILIGNKSSMLDKVQRLGVALEGAGDFLRRWDVEERAALGAGLGATPQLRLVSVSDWHDALRVLKALQS